MAVQLSSPNTRALRFEEIVRLEDLCIRIVDCVTVGLGPIDEERLRVLVERGYDHAPVYEPNTRRVWGLVETSYLKHLQEVGQELSSNDPAVRDEEVTFRVGRFTDIYRLLENLVTRRSIIVINEADDSGFDRIFGLFTISDLNRHPIRSIIYRLLAAAEEGLASILESAIAEPWDWIKLMSEEHQVRVIGYWEVSKKRGVDIGPVSVLNLSQLVNIFAKSVVLFRILGFSSRNEFEGATGKIAEFRNRVMHPVRPLILGQDDVHDLYEVTLILEYLRDKSENELKKKIGG